MIFITGPMFSGKREYALTLCSPDEALFDAETLAADCPDLDALCDSLCGKYKVITASELGGGIVPIDPGERAMRDAAGRLSRMLASRAETVVRVFCGIPTIIKGELI